MGTVGSGMRERSTFTGRRAVSQRGYDESNQCQQMAWTRQTSVTVIQRITPTPWDMEKCLG